LLSPQNLKAIYHNVRNTKTKKKRHRVRNLRDINRILSRKLGDTQKYLSQQIKNIELEREGYKKQVEELTRELQNQKTIDTKD
jgi:hypothetical protein